MKNFEYIFINSANEKQCIWIKASNWAKANELFYQQNPNCKEIIQARNHN